MLLKDKHIGYNNKKVLIIGCENAMLGREIRDDIKSREEICDIIYKDEFKNVFLKKDIKNVIIFGSFSGGDFTDESDIDIAVIPEKELCFTNEIDIEAQLEDLFGRSIDIININNENINVLIKIEALNSKLIIMKNEKYEEAQNFYENYYKENEEFWYFLDREVLYNE